jgi:transcription initiation factor TFIIE subunit alpha
MKVANVIAGEDAVKVVMALESMGETMEDQISAEIGVGLNEVRKILYKLYDHSIVTSKRLRCEETGWFVFRWRLQPDQVEGFVLNQKRRVLEKLEMRLNYEKSHDFYYCFNAGYNRLTFEDAIELAFRCPTCGKSLQHFDNSRIIKVLEERIDLIRMELTE